MEDLEYHKEALIVCTRAGRGPTMNDMSSYVSEVMIGNEMKTVRSTLKACHPVFQHKGDRGFMWSQDSGNAQH